MRFIVAAGRGVDPHAMTQTQHRRWLLAIDHQDPDVVMFTEQWKPRYRLGILRNLRGYRLALPRWPYGNGGTGVAWLPGAFANRGHPLARGGVRLHGLVRQGNRIVSGFRSLRWVDLDTGSGVLTAAAAHITPHPAKGGNVRAAWHQGMGRARAFAIDQIHAGHHVAIGIDGNTDHDGMVEEWGAQLAGQPVRIVSAGLCHLILIGRWEVQHHEVLESTPSDHPPLIVDAEPLP